MVSLRYDFIVKPAVKLLSWDLFLGETHWTESKLNIIDDLTNSRPSSASISVRQKGKKDIYTETGDESSDFTDLFPLVLHSRGVEWN